MIGTILNETCQVSINPCHSYDLGAEIDGNKYAGYFGYPANECGNEDYPLPARGLTIRDMALLGNTIPRNYQPTVGYYDPTAPCDHLPAIHVRSVGNDESVAILNYKTRTPFGNRIAPQ